LDLAVGDLDSTLFAGLDTSLDSTLFAGLDTSLDSTLFAGLDTSLVSGMTYMHHPENS